jgi:hypothetical protein
MATEYFTHINRGTIDSNRKHGTKAPTMRVQKGRWGRPTYAHQISLPAGSVLTTLDDPLPCGARVVIISPTRPEVVQ